VADGYLFTVSNWTRLVGVNLALCAPERAEGRIAARPAVQSAMEAERLIK
jgi:glutathione S-transferase